MRHLKHHAMHLLMCAPMLVIALIAIASGASFAFLLPVLGCALMMWMMMRMMMGPTHSDHERR